MEQINLIKKAAAAVLAMLALSIPAYASGTNDNCLMCHSAPDLTKTAPGGKAISLHVDNEQFASSIHGSQRCVDCHADLQGASLPHEAGLKPVDCTRCHEARGEHGSYMDSVHGKAASLGDADAPRCKDCHGTHNIRPASDEKSTVYRSNIPNTCSKCHSDPKITDSHGIPARDTLKYYEQSVHGRALKQKGMLGAAVCTDCHGAHDVQPASEKLSAVNKANIPATCGKCHSDILAGYRKGIHGQAANKGIKDAPVCTDCHGEHTIKPVKDRSSSVYPTHVVATCSKCHDDKRIARRYGLPANRLSSYMGSYHGVANRMGETTVANCATCHGSHEILPSSNPHSSVNKANLPKTCGKCHPGASANFAKGTVHLAPTPKKDKLIFLVRVGYALFVTGMIASFCMYIAMDLFTRAKRKRH